ncbi:MAG: PH domain-containing protein [Muribaculaceae bacterium]|nr:PH domain-containing protein [Muribaculaceae bacterium]
MPSQWTIPRSKTTVLFTIGYMIVMALVWGLLFFRTADNSGRLLCYILIAVLALIFILAFMFSPRRLILGDDTLTIERTVGSRQLPLEDIAEVRRVYIPPGGNVRICGVGGLFGNVGWYYTRDTGRYFAYTGSTSGTVLITMKSGRKYMVNSVDTEAFIVTLRSKL